MAENWKHFYDQMKKMVAMYQDEIVPGLRQQVEELEAKIATDNNVGSKWIPVTERLPDKHGKPCVCLLTFPHGGQFPYILNWYEYGDNGYVNGRHFQDEGMDGMKVTHWMPMPEAPKGE